MAASRRRGHYYLHKSEKLAIFEKLLNGEHLHTTIRTKYSVCKNS